MNINYFNAGRRHAEYQIASGWTEPEDAPLSGEWAGSPTPDSIVHQYGPANPDYWEFDTAADDFEAGYFSAPWPSTVEV